MFSTLRTRFGIPGVISVIALVFAMFGGAYAASNSSNSGKATASAKAKGKPGPRGKTGKTGPAGPQGPAGPAGPAGAKGDAGAAGSNGTNGKDGTDGTSVVASNLAEGTANCEGRAGSKFVTGATTTFACNGKDGAGGGGGFPATLPSGATETGSFYFKGDSTEGQTTPIDWSIPLSPADAAAITESHIHVVGSEGGGVCAGNSREPAAPAGELCFYKAEGAGGIFTSGSFEVREMAPIAESAAGVSTGGALIYFESSQPPTTWVEGSFAITAP